MAAIIENTETQAPSVERTRCGTYAPAVDIIETDNELLLIADVPGASAEGIDINYERGELTLHARVPRRQDADTRYLLREYGVGDYYRCFRVGEGIDAQKISAEVNAGVLTLHLPKAEAIKPRKIRVNPAS
jgi:HSP20 family protein